MAMGQRGGRKRIGADVPRKSKAGVEKSGKTKTASDKDSPDSGDAGAWPDDRDAGHTVPAGAGNGQGAHAGVAGQDLQIPASVLGGILGLTEQRVTQLVTEGMPRIGRGLYPLAGCVQWYVNYWKLKAEGRANPTRQEGDLLRNQVLAAKLAKETGDFVPRKEVVNIWTATFLRIGKSLDGLGASLNREFGLPADVQAGMRERIDEYRANFVRDSAEFIDAAQVEAAAPPPAKGKTRGG